MGGLILLSNLFNFKFYGAVLFSITRFWIVFTFYIWFNNFTVHCSVAWSCIASNIIYLWLVWLRILRDRWILLFNFLTYLTLGFIVLCYSPSLACGLYLLFIFDLIILLSIVRLWIVFTELLVIMISNSYLWLVGVGYYR